MGIAHEESFPRGGKKPPPLNALDKKSRSAFKLFGQKRKNKQSYQPGKKVEKERFTLDPTQKISAVSAELLTYKTIQEGMIVLGCIKQIQKLGITISLPGRLSCYAPITNISLPYTKLLKNIVEENNAPEDFQSISKLFVIGQYVRCKVMEVVHSTSNDLHKVTVSLSPNDVQSDWVHSQLEKGVVITAAVCSKEDHGYVMETGIKNVRAFLPIKNVDKELGVGQVIWCSVQKTTKTENANTIALNAKQENVVGKTYTGGTLQSLLPGMKVDFTVSKVLKDGYEGTFLDEFTGYINETQLLNSKEKLLDHEVDDVLQAYVLYVMPTTKLAYLTLRDIGIVPEATLSEGFTTNAKISSRVSKGLYLQLAKNHKGFVSYRRLKTAVKSTENIETALNAYQPGSMHRCRVLDYDYMENVYICTLEKDLVNEKYFSINDFQLGDLVQVVIEKITPRGIEVQAGRLSGFVANLHLSDIPLQSSTIAKKFQVGQKVNARVLNIEDKSLRFTFKQSLVESKLPPLTSYENIDKNQEYQGFIVNVSKGGLLVAFYGDVRGFVPANQLNIRENVSIQEIFYVGQFIKCRVLIAKPAEKRLTLTLKTGQKSIKISSLIIGKKVTGSVTNVTENGLELSIKKFEGVAILPTLHLSEHPALCPLLLDQYKVGDVLPNLVCVGTSSQNAYLSIREQSQKECYTFDEVQENMLLRCSFKSSNEKGLTLFSPIRDYRKYVFISKRNVSENFIDDIETLNLQKYQPLIAKVLTVDRENPLILGSTKVSDCGGFDTTFAVKNLASYLSTVESIRKSWVTAGKKLTELEVGSHVNGKVVSISDEENYEVSLKGKISAILPKSHCKSELEVGQKVKGVILWIDYPSNNVIISSKYIEQLNEAEKGLQLKGRIEAEVVLIHEDFILTFVKLEDQYTFVFLPAKWHYNQLEKNDLSAFEIGTKLTIGISQISINDWYIGTDKKLKTINKIKPKETTLTDKPRKPKEVTEVRPIIDHPLELNECTTNKEESMAKTKKKRKAETDSPKKTKKTKSEPDSVSNIVNTVLLPGVDNFWNLTSDALHDTNNTTEEDEPSETEEQPNKKKKLTKAEKIEEAKQKELEIRKKEILLADENAQPTTAEQFDRLVLAQPNNSHMWISYMAFHLQSTEIEKARAIARKALSTISFREEQEKLNVWLALLNLENRYGTKDSFMSVLNEASRMNDARIVHMRALQILADTGKATDFTELLNTVLRKYKHESSTWYESAAACYQLGMHEKARHIFQRALSSLEQKQHVDFIVKFAYLEVKHGNIDRAETLFEQVLASYAKRIDIWSSYVDMLVKAGKVDIARKVLERATSLKLPARKMKTLFKKFIDFEKVHGDESAVEKVKLLAVQYVESATS